MLKHKESNTTNFDIVDDSNTTNKYPSIISDSNITETHNHVKIQNDLKKDPLWSYIIFQKVNLCLEKSSQYLEKTLIVKQQKVK